MNTTKLVLGCLAAAAVMLGGLGCEREGGAEANTEAVSLDSAGRCPHEIKVDKCPFCTPSLVESDGFCGEHGVAEALCAECRPYLKAAFRAKGDWCEEHKTPESQCFECNPELKENVRPGEHGVAVPAANAAAAGEAGQCEHGIAEAKCPFCTPSLVESDGFCGGHGVPEALCVECRPFLKTAFVAKGDWCAEHDTPESQCALCNPELKDNPGEG